jgi:hypothetical protein
MRNVRRIELNKCSSLCYSSNLDELKPEKTYPIEVDKRPGIYFNDAKLVGSRVEYILDSIAYSQMPDVFEITGSTSEHMIYCSLISMSSLELLVPSS